MAILKNKKVVKKDDSIQKKDPKANGDIIKNIQDIMNGDNKTTDIIELTKVIHDDHDEGESVQSSSQRHKLITDIQASLSDLNKLNPENLKQSKKDIDKTEHISESNIKDEKENSLKNIIKKELGKACESKHIVPESEEQNNPRIKNFVEDCINRSVNEWINNNIEILVENWMSNNLAYLLHDVLAKWLANNGNNAIKELLKKEIEDAVKEIYDYKENNN